MTVRELIAVLETLDQSSRVVTRGYESGAVDATGVEERSYWLDVNAYDHYEGQHQEVDDWQKLHNVVESCYLIH